ncbi:MAG: hypothetical protein ACRD6X_19770 [Pyrinomonadaceae bacterium]
MGNFGKRLECPNSYDLADHQAGMLEVHKSRTIEEHLITCEFCCAEAKFYELYDICEDTEIIEPAPKIPEPLYELAVAILGDR